ncbi:hypothetical protein [Nostoc sp. DSM 114159]
MTQKSLTRRNFSILRDRLKYLSLFQYRCQIKRVQRHKKRDESRRGVF